MQETESIDNYILSHIDQESEYLKALYRATHVKLLRPRMASGHLQGRMLKMFVQMIRPKKILEIGTYSGYSALCLAEGLADDGVLYTFEINDEQEDFTRPWLENSPYADKINDAKKQIESLMTEFREWEKRIKNKPYSKVSLTQPNKQTPQDVHSLHWISC